MNEPTGRFRVIIVDDHPLYRDGVARALAEHPEFEVVGQVGLGKEGLAEIRRLVPDVAVVDLQLPDVDGISIAEAVVNDGLPTHVAIVSAYEDSASVYRALAAGAKAYIPKVLSGADLSHALLSVAAGKTVIPPALQGGIAQEIRARRERDQEPVLTARELDVLRLAADGMTAQHIAEQLFVGVATVKTHLQHIFEKLGASDRASAVAAAIRRGILS